MDFTGAERLGLLMLCDIYDATTRDAEFDTKFIRKAIYGGHFWALKSELPGVFDAEARSEEAVREVSDILAMWRSLERDFALLPENEREKVLASPGAFGHPPRFSGFDGNAGDGYLGIASFMVDGLNWYDEFKGRELNSHGAAPIDGQRRMLAEYRQVRGKQWHGPLAADDLIAVLAEQVHPSMR